MVDGVKRKAKAEVREVDRDRKREDAVRREVARQALVQGAPTATTVVAQSLAADAPAPATKKLTAVDATPKVAALSSPEPTWSGLRRASKTAAAVRAAQAQLGTTIAAKTALEQRPKLSAKETRTLATLVAREAALKAKLTELGATEEASPLPVRPAPSDSRTDNPLVVDLPPSLFAGAKEIEQRKAHEANLMKLQAFESWSTPAQAADIMREATKQLSVIERAGPSVMTVAEGERLTSAIEHSADGAQAQVIISSLGRARALQERLLNHGWSTPKEATELANALRTEKHTLGDLLTRSELAYELREVDAKLAATSDSNARRPLLNQRDGILRDHAAVGKEGEGKRSAILASADYLAQIIGNLASEYGPRLQKAGESKENTRYMAALERYNTALRKLVDGTENPDAMVRELDAARKVIDDPSSTASKVYKTVGWMLTNMMSYEALRHTGVQTTWGFRTYIPGTFGIGGNVGPWLQAYSGSINQYDAQAVPFRLNPGVTLSLPLAQLSYSRAGFGSGFSLPFAQSYVDPVRYRMLFGMDGVGFTSMGEWQYRGPYLQISGSIPLGFIPVSVTWATSLFNPGLAPLVQKGRPIAVATQTMVQQGVRLVTGKKPAASTP